MGLNSFGWNQGDLDPMACLQQVALIDAVYWDRQDAFASILSRYGGGQIRAWHFQPNSWPPSWALYEQAERMVSAITHRCDHLRTFVSYEKTMAEFHRFPAGEGKNK